jgi:hypothetical protein
MARTDKPGDLLYPETLPGGKIPKSVRFSCNVVSTVIAVSAIAGVQFRVLAAAIGFGSAASCGFYASNTSIIAGPFYGAAGTNLVLPFNEVGWFKTSHGQDLNAWEVAAATVTGVLIYVED